MSLKLIIFDLDGTLIDSSVDLTHAINYAIEPYGAPKVTVRETIGLVGEGISRLMEKVVEKESIEADKALLIDRFLEHYSAHLVDNTVPYPGVPEMLAQLSDYRKAVISNKRESLSKVILEKLNLSVYLDLIMGSDSAGAKKPSPVPVFHVLSKLGISPEKAVIVGDSIYDIKAGKAAGIRTIAVTYGYRPAAELQEADFIINTVDELAKILKKMGPGQKAKG